MRFFEPHHLWWLLPLVPIIIFFYLLKLKRREMVVSSTFLWNHLVKDVQANAPFQKLKRNLLLFLQLLIVLLAVTALARPAIITRAFGGSNVVVILDGSASMQSRDASGTRFDAARAQVRRMINDMHSGDRMMLLLSTNRTHRLTGFTTDKRELHQALNRSHPRDTSTDLSDAVRMAASAAAQRAGSRIYVLSDGAFPEMEEIDTRGAELQFLKVGTRAENVGIVAMDVRRGYEERSGYQMFVAVRNYSPKPQQCNVEFYRDDALIDVRPLELPAADAENGFTEKAEVLENLRETTGVLRARLDLRDDLDADNEAWVQLAPQRRVRVLLVTDGNLYLEKALNLDPQVDLSVAPPSAYHGQSGYDVVVFENIGPKQVGPGSHLYINCSGPSAPVEVKGRVTNATIIDWDRTHPLMRFVKLSQLQMGEALTVSRKPWATALAEHEDGTVVAVGEHEGTKSAYVGFSLLKSEFPLRVAFPIFFNNLVQWLAAQPGKTEGLQLRAGQPARIEVPEGLAEVTVTTPDGRREAVKVDGRTAYFGDTETRGLYTVAAKDPKQFSTSFVVNLLSRDESATAPQDKLQFGRRPVLANTGATRTAREIWQWLALLAVVVLGLEWWVYHRRI